jgi:hypothetical protein
MSKWSLLEHLTNSLERPRLGDKKPPNFWPSESSAVITNDYGEEVAIGKCRRQIFLRYLYDCFDFYPEKYKHFQPLIDRIQTDYVPPDKYLRWIWIQGELYEEYCVRQATLSGVHVASQVPAFYVSPHGWTLSGKIDEVVLNPTTILNSCVEYKSVYGFNGGIVLGTESERRRGLLGTPRESNLMQVAFYDFQVGKKQEGFENTRLCYGSRDTGKFAEYEIDVKQDESGEHFIHYSGLAPNTPGEVKSKISMENIFSQFTYVLNSLDSGNVPGRDYDHTYTEEQVEKKYERGELNKTISKRVEKRLEQKKEGKKRINKLPDLGDFWCKNCSFRKICYDSSNNPIAL